MAGNKSRMIASDSALGRLFQQDAGDVR